MWGVDDSSAETMTMNPWNGVPQSQVWPGMTRASGAAPAPGNGGNYGPSTAAAVLAMRGGPRPGWDASGGWPGGPQGGPQWVPPNVAGATAPTWPMTQQQWGANNSSNGTYADQAKKNMSAPPVRNPTGGPTRFEGGVQTWGGLKVDQQTPWDTGAGAAMQEMKTDWSGGAGGRWNANAAATGAPTWTGGGSPAEWQQHRHDGAPVAAHWAHGAPNPGAAVLAVAGGAQPATWGQQVQPGIPGASPAENRLVYDPNPQTPGPWVAPAPTEMNNDMMWHDPNPKQKKVQRDTGTSVWGDPTTQQEIRRWKESEDDPSLSGMAGGVADWTTSMPPLTTVSPPLSAAPVGWGEPTAMGGTGNDGTERWGSGGWGEKSMAYAGDASDNNSPSDHMLKLQSNGAGIMEQMKGDRADLASLTQQIADQLRVAVSKGLINTTILNQPLPQNTLVLLNQLLQRVPKFEQANQELQQLCSQGNLNQAQQAERVRLAKEIDTLKKEISQFQMQIDENTQSGGGARGQNGLDVPQLQATTPSDGGSRLHQWKTGVGSDGIDKTGMGSASDSNLPGLVAAAQHLSLSADAKSSEWKSGTLDWSPPGSTSDMNNEIKGDETVGGGLDKVLSSAHHSSNATPTPPVDDGPPEFVPGKRWEWRDPNKVAEDPNATPGNCKPNPLLSSSGGNGGGGAGGFFGQQPLLADNAKGYGSGNWGAMPTAGFADAWQGGRSRPPSQLGQPGAFVAGPPPRAGMPGNLPPTGNTFNRSMSSPGQQHSAFQAYGPSGAWILIQLNAMNEQQIRGICQKYGQLVNFYVPPGANVALAKYMDSNIDGIVIRLKSELFPLGVQLRVVMESEIERMMKGNRGAGNHPPLFVPVTGAAAGGWPTAAPPDAPPTGWPFPSTGELMPPPQHLFQHDDLPGRPF